MAKTPDRVGYVARAGDIRAVRARHPWRWPGTVVVVVLVAMLIHFLVASRPLEWGIVFSYLTNPLILLGVQRTIELTVLCMAIGIAFGTVLAVMRMSPNPIMRGTSWAYIWFFRGTPVLVQLFFWYALPTVIHSLSIGVPFGPSWFHTNPAMLITQFAAVAFGLGLNEAAYMAEVVRAGILSVDAGQTEAGQVLGMRRILILRRIVLPQAMRVIIPPTGNETISMLKSTSLASTVGYAELFFQSELIAARNYQVIPLLITASLWYLFITSVLYIGQHYLERYFARGSRPVAGRFSLPGRGGIR